MKISIVYTDYKNQKIYNRFINCNFKSNVSFSHLNNMNIHNRKQLNKAITTDTVVTEFTHDDGEEYYRVNLSHNEEYQNHWDYEELLNSVCSSLFIAVPKNDISVLKILIDKNVLTTEIDVNNQFNDVIINLNIHDTKSVLNMIKILTKTKID